MACPGSHVAKFRKQRWEKSEVYSWVMLSPTEIELEVDTILRGGTLGLGHVEFGMASSGKMPQRHGDRGGRVLVWRSS